jgi:hypothetical protein
MEELDKDFKIRKKKDRGNIKDENNLLFQEN